MFLFKKQQIPSFQKICLGVSALHYIDRLSKRKEENPESFSSTVEKVSKKQEINKWEMDERRDESAKKKRDSKKKERKKEQQQG